MKHNVSRIASNLLLPVITLLLPLANASELGLKTMQLPLYIPLAMGAIGMELHKTPSPVSVLSLNAEPEATIEFLNSPFVPHHDTSWTKTTDTNLISLCGVKISYTQLKNKEATGAFAMEVQIDATAFKKPENIAITDAEVMAIIQQTVAANFPNSKVVILQ
jgi:hypothetical protein